MKKGLILFFIALFNNTFSQGDVILKTGDPSPNFILTLDGNSIQSFIMPYMKRIVLLHFWSHDVITSRIYGKRLTGLMKRSQNAVYKNAEGFEVIFIAVQSDKTSWKESILHDSLSAFTNGIAVKGLNDAVCKKYGVISLPTDILIDESGIIIAIDPKITDVENILDERKNIQPIRKDITGILAQSSNKSDVLKYGKLYLFNVYGDSISKTTADSKGGFTFSDIKLNQDLIVKVDNQSDIITTDPIALYLPSGDFFMDGRTNAGGFEFHIPTRLNNKLTRKDSSGLSELAGHLDVIKTLIFKNNGLELTPKDEKELNSIIENLQKNKTLMLEFYTHTDARADSSSAIDITAREANTIKNYLHTKGIAFDRITAIAKGNTEQRKLCGGMADCTDEDHKLNRRVEFIVYKD